MHRIIFCVSDASQRAGKQVTAESTEKYKAFWSTEVIDLKWRGGAVADLLNADTELKKTLVKMEQTEIRIEPDRKRKCVRIFSNHILDFDHEVPSVNLFAAYDRIAGHVRTALTL